MELIGWAGMRTEPRPGSPVSPMVVACALSGTWSHQGRFSGLQTSQWNPDSVALEKLTP